MLWPPQHVPGARWASELDTVWPSPDTPYPGAQPSTHLAPVSVGAHDLSRAGLGTRELGEPPGKAYTADLLGLWESSWVIFTRAAPKVQGDRQQPVLKWGQLLPAGGVDGLVTGASPSCSALPGGRGWGQPASSPMESKPAAPGRAGLHSAPFSSPPSQQVREEPTHSPRTSGEPPPFLDPGHGSSLAVAPARPRVPCWLWAFVYTVSGAACRRARWAALAWLGTRGHSHVGPARSPAWLCAACSFSPVPLPPLPGDGATGQSPRNMYLTSLNRSPGLPLRLLGSGLLRLCPLPLHFGGCC